MDIDADAPVITRDEILSYAPIDTIWRIQTDVAGWPSWQPDVDGAQVDGPLSVGAVFHWQTSGLDIRHLHRRGGRRAPPDRVGRSRTGHHRHPRLDPRPTRRRRSRQNGRVVGGRPGDRPGRGVAGRTRRVAAHLVAEPQAGSRRPVLNGCLGSDRAPRVIARSSDVRTTGLQAFDLRALVHALQRQAGGAGGPYVVSRKSATGTAPALTRRHQPAWGPRDDARGRSERHPTPRAAKVRRAVPYPLSYEGRARGVSLARGVRTGLTGGTRPGRRSGPGRTGRSRRRPGRR
jgi:hypothetical protein